MRRTASTRDQASCPGDPARHVRAATCGPSPCIARVARRSVAGPTRLRRSGHEGDARPLPRPLRRGLRPALVYTPRLLEGWAHGWPRMGRRGSAGGAWVGGWAVGRGGSDRGLWVGAVVGGGVGGQEGGQVKRFVESRGPLHVQVLDANVASCKCRSEILHDINASFGKWRLCRKR